MESNKVADDVRMKLTGKMVCPHCCQEIKPARFSLKGSGMWQSFCPKCRLAIYATKPENTDTKHPHKET